MSKLTAAVVEVDDARMHDERLARARAGLRRHGLPAALLFDPLNVRYAVAPGPFAVFNMHVSFRWALVPVESEPVLWEYPEALHVTAERFSGEVRPAVGWTFFGSGSNTVRDARRFAAEIADVLDERGLAGEPIGVDRLETVGHLALADAGLRIADAQPAIERARAVKTEDELEVLRANARICDAAIEELRAVLRPGVSEDELWGTFVGAALRRGAQWCEARLLSSGQRTNPWMREATPRVVQDGELVAFDTDLVGARGYLTDISRTYLCGDRAPTDEQRRLHRVAYDYLHDCLPEFRRGASFEELGRKLGPRLPGEFQAQRYAYIAHGTGMVDEYPCVTFDDHHDGEIQAGMVLSVEAYVGAVGGRQGVKLEEQIVIGDDGPEIMSGAPYDERLET